MIIDEIYIARRVEYSSGEVLSLTADGNVASTLLCFMVKSVAGKYKDIVAIYPMDRLTAMKQKQCYDDVMTLLHQTDLNVVAISVDNASTNRKFYIDCLCVLIYRYADCQRDKVYKVSKRPLKHFYNMFCDV